MVSDWEVEFPMEVTTKEEDLVVILVGSTEVFTMEGLVTLEENKVKLEKVLSVSYPLLVFSSHSHVGSLLTRI